jgi:hypothetical protein
VSNPNKAKGSAWERVLTEYLRFRGLHANRMPAGAALDRGDISLEDGQWTIEAKNLKTISLPSILAEAMTEQANAGTKYHVATIKRRGVATAPTAFAVMSIEQWVDIVEELKLLEELRLLKAAFLDDFKEFRAG